MFKVEKVTKIDPSNTKIIFDSIGQSSLFIKNQIKNSSDLELKMEDESQLPRTWMELKPYYINQTERNIYFRYCTILEQAT